MASIEIEVGVGNPFACFFSGDDGENASVCIYVILEITGNLYMALKNSCRTYETTTHSIPLFLLRNYKQSADV